MLLYSSVINLLSGLINACGMVTKDRHPKKFFRFVKGQQGIIRHVRDTYKPADDKTTVWIHAASFGEYSVARPLITELKNRGYRTVVTFFSPSGYEAVQHNHPHVDYLYYLPFDTRANARAFLDTVKPDKAVFIVSEYWFNYLDLLKQKGIDTYLVSAKVTDKSIFFRWYGKMYRRCLKTYKHIFTVDDESKRNLASLGKHEVSVIGNPLFDNAIEKAQADWSDPVIERFTKGQKVFIAGSIHDDNDLRLVAALANNHPDVKFLMVPHETGARSTAEIKQALKGTALAYSECTPDTDLTFAQALIIDFVGALAYIYRYAQWAYIGGGFTRYLHSLIEATVYGLPVAFGPMTMRKITPQQIAELGIGAIVSDPDELNRWFSSLKRNPKRLKEISVKAKEYVKANAGSTNKIVNAIMS